jgi:CelD/BcsL family acetyltransferase involved in cellulose biosynthesis
LSTLIEAQITRGASVFDFLKGDEAYKFRHGGEARDLFIVEGRLR